MGNSYHAAGPNKGKVTCGGCGPGVGRKRPCPIGWCPASYYCAACWPAHKADHAAYHANCAEKREKTLAANPELARYMLEADARRKADAEYKARRKLERAASNAALPRCEVPGCELAHRYTLVGSVKVCLKHLKRIKAARQASVAASGNLAILALGSVPSRETLLAWATAEGK